VIYNKNFKLKSNTKVKKYKSYQVMEALTETDVGTLRMINVYRPLEEFSDYLCDLASKPGTPIIAGDFNLHVERPDDLCPEKFFK